MHEKAAGIKAGDRVKIVNQFPPQAMFMRAGDGGEVLHIDRDGDLWVRWDNPVIQNPPTGWCCGTAEAQKVEG